MQAVYVFMCVHALETAAWSDMTNTTMKALQVSAILNALNEQLARMHAHYSEVTATEMSSLTQ